MTPTQMNPTTTLRAIREHSPCADVWAKVLNGLGPDLDAPISLGDIAASNGAADALWCLRAFDWWSDIAFRRAVIGGAILPTVKRASAHTNAHVSGVLARLTRWASGDDTVTLMDVRNADVAAYTAAAGTVDYAAHAAGAYAATAYAAYATCVENAAYAATAYAIYATCAENAAYAAGTVDYAVYAAAAYAADAVADAAAYAAERAQQRADIIAAFVPV